MDKASSSILKLTPMQLVFASALLAAGALTIALRLTRPTVSNADFTREHLTDTPERAADSFIDAYRAGDFERAAHFATPALAAKLRGQRPLPRAEDDPEGQHEAFVVQESHRNGDQSLKLQGVVLREGEEESEGHSVSLTLHKLDGRYLVEELTW